MPRLLLVADFACTSGFARVAEALAEELSDRWDIHVLALNYHGDPHPYQGIFKLYPAGSRGDNLGVNRLSGLVDAIMPDAILIINDPWICPFYLNALRNRATAQVQKLLSSGAKIDAQEFAKAIGTGERPIADMLGELVVGSVITPPVVCYMPVDGPGLRQEYVRQLNLANVVVAYTEFGKKELLKAGLKVPCSVIPHGIDLEMFYPLPKQEARAVFNLPQEDHIVLCANRNSMRKRLDLTIMGFAHWVHSTKKPPRFKLFLHCYQKDVGYDLQHLAQTFNIEDRVLVNDEVHGGLDGMPIEYMRALYSACDVYLSTSMGEGWGLPVMEAMACELPTISPRWSALGEWAEGATHYMECSSVIASDQRINTLHGEVHPHTIADALEKVWKNAYLLRDNLVRDGQALVKQPKFRWKNIADQFHGILTSALPKQDGGSAPAD